MSNKELREEIARVLKSLRERSGLTAEQVGQLIGKSGKTVNAWENNRGQPDAEMLMKLSEIYHCENIFDEFATKKATISSRQEMVAMWIDILSDLTDDDLDLIHDFVLMIRKRRGL